MTKTQITARLAKRGFELHKFTSSDTRMHEGREDGKPFKLYIASEGRLTHKFRFLSEIADMLERWDENRF